MAMSLPWLADVVSSLRAARTADRLPHGLLIHEAPGAGGDWLANWIARMLLCTHDDPPCDACAACQRVAAGQHPDLLEIRPVEDSRQIRIEQVRELAQDLALTSHQGGYKVGIVSPADSMNRFAANAMLKTLEEPPPRTVLVLVVSQPSRLPATILSRCQRIRVKAPARTEAVAWLESVQGSADWPTVLAVLGDAPLLALQADPGEVTRIAQEVRESLQQTAAGHADPVALAERWSRAELPLRLRCFENWLTERIRAQWPGGGFLTEVGAVPYLSEAGTVLNIRHLFELLDGVRDLKSALETPINRGLALEGLLRRLPGAAGLTR